MATIFKHHNYLSLLVMIIFMMFSLHLGQCLELDVGGDKGWATPSAKNDQVYNDWASSNRFKVNDTLRFVYKKDSVLAVTQEEYDKCRSSYPMFFSNTGDTVFTLDRPGLFYFISGVADHCNRGLKMIVKVLDPPQPSNQTAAPTTTTTTNGATALRESVVVLPIVVAVTMVLVCLFFM